MEFQKAEFLEEGEVVALVGLDANAIARLGQAFPVPVVVRGERYWSRAEVEAWLVYGTSDC